MDEEGARCPLCGWLPEDLEQAVNHLLTDHRGRLIEDGIDVDAAAAQAEQLIKIMEGLGSEGACPNTMAFIINPESAQDILFLIDTNEIRYQFIADVAVDEHRAASVIAGLLSCVKLCVLASMRLGLDIETELRRLLLEQSHVEEADA